MNNLRLKENLKISKIKDKYILLNLDTGIYFSINKVGKDICDILEKTTDINEVTKVLSKNYNVSVDTLDKDIKDFINILIEHKLILMD